MIFFRVKLLLIPILFVFYVPAQTGNADSLLQNLKIHLAKHEAAELENTAIELLHISEEQNNIPNQLEALKYLGISMHLQSKYDTAIIWYNGALTLSKKQNDTLNTAKCYLNIATSYNSKGDFENAVKNALEAEKGFEAVNDKNGQGRVQNLLGVFYFNREDYSTAYNYFQKYNQLAVASNDTGEIVSSMNNMAAALHVLERYSEERQLLRKSISIQEAQGQYIRIGSAYENLGTLYMETDSLNEASILFHKAFNSYNANNNTRDIARLLLQTGRLKKRQNNYSGAKNDFEKALKYSEEGGFLDMKKEALNQLALLFAEQSDFKNAYFTLTDYMDAKDSVLNEQNQESINKLMIEFETEKKEHQIAQQQLEIAQKTLQNRHKSTIITFLGGTIAIIILLALIIYSRIKIKQERQLNNERLQMKQLQMKVVLESQESERKRFARDLHDGFGQLITAVKMMLSQMYAIDEPDKRSELALKSNEMLDTMHSQLREIAHNLMPEQLLNEGLISALKDYVLRISKNTDIQITVNAFGIEKRLDQTVEINVYRIIQEWINNVIKYSGAEKLTLQLTGFDNEINILIEDNGKGFKKEQLTKSRGWGWKNIQSRLEAINGILEIDSQEGTTGTSFILDLPIA